MNKLLKWLLILASVFALALLALVFILPRVFDPNEQKDDLEKMVAEATGRSFEIQGEIQWSVFPILGFSAGPLLLGNAAGFESEQFARIGNAKVSVQVMPLFGGEVKVGALEINALELDLEVNAAGENNWQSLAQGSSAPASTTGGGATDTAALRIENINLTGGIVRYQDRMAGVKIQSNDISVKTSTLELGQPLETVIRMSVASEYWSGPMVIALTVAVDDPLAADPGKIRVQSLNMEGKLSENLPLVFELTQPFELDPDSGELRIEQWKISAGPAQLRGSLDVATGDKGDSVLSGRLDIAPFDARKLLVALNGSAPNLANPDSLSRVSAGANWKVAGDSARLTELEIQLDDSKINGEFDFKSIASLSGSAKLNIDQIDLDQYMAAASGEPEAASGEPENLSIPKSQLTAELKIARLQLAGAKAENVSFSFSSAGKGFKLFPVKADLYQGQLKGGLNMRKGVNGELVIRNTLKDISAAPLLADLLGESLISGTGNLVVDLAITEPFAVNPMSSANGKLEFRFKDGAVHGVDVLGLLRQATQLLGRGSDELTDQDPATEFSSLIISAVIENGVMSTPKMVLQSPYLRITGDGTIDLAGNSLDYTIKPVLVSTPAGQGGVGLEKLEGIAIPVMLSGTLDQPNWRIDPTQLLLATQRGQLGESATQLLESISGSDKDKDGDETDLLGGLLNEAAKRDKKKKSADPDNG